MNSAEKRKFLEETYRLEAKNMIRYAKSAFGSNSQAEDVVHTVFQIALEKIDDFVYSPKPVGWLKTTLKNEIKNRSREQMKWRMAIMDIEINNIAHYDDYAIETSFYGIDPKALELLNKIYIEGIPYPELAREMGISINALKMRIYRVKDKIRHQLPSR